ncbi:MAG: hypothetical protein D6727_10635 [Gammaproteobacteria bacterium]|nr:MAG: hypothetical protein D6727_10635 [Gammaproteobacteria bacterium]
MKSWKTTLAGIAAIVAAIALAIAHQFDSDPTTAADWSAVITALTAGVGLVLARDNDKTSEQAGAR